MNPKLLSPRISGLCRVVQSPPVISARYKYSNNPAILGALPPQSLANRATNGKKKTPISPVLTKSGKPLSSWHSYLSGLRPLSPIAGAEIFVSAIFSNVAEKWVAQVTFTAELAAFHPSEIAFLRYRFAMMGAHPSHVKDHD